MAADKVETMNADQMREALSAIAQEMEKFQYNTDTSFESNLSGDEAGGEKSREVKALKTKLKLRKLQVKRLKENITTACLIAKTVISAKDKESLSLNDQLNFARQESANLLKQNEENARTTEKLTIANHLLSDKLENIYNFIELGYKELQKLRDEALNDTSAVMRLKQIMLCCGQYYADYCNERERCLQLEQRNRFLSNKLSILESNLETATDKLRLLENYPLLKCRPNTAKNLKTKSDGRTCMKNVAYVHSEQVFGKRKSLSKASIETLNSNRKIDALTKHGMHNLDLSSHLSLVKSLLSDQDSMLESLKQLADELECKDYTPQ